MGNEWERLARPDALTVSRCWRTVVLARTHYERRGSLKKRNGPGSPSRFWGREALPYLPPSTIPLWFAGVEPPGIEPGSARRSESLHSRAVVDERRRHRCSTRFGRPWDTSVVRRPRLPTEGEPHLQSGLVWVHARLVTRVPHSANSSRGDTDVSGCVVVRNYVAPRVVSGRP